jgi:hypothetical protein
VLRLALPRFPKSSEQTFFSGERMAASCWRLLVVCSLILVAPIVLRSQDSVEERIPFFRPKVSMLRYAPSTPERLPPSSNIPRRSPLTTRTLGFQEIAGAAGISFSGQVTSISRTLVPAGEAPPSTTLTFHVERAIRGPSPGQNLTIHEWAGLWDRGEHYHVGERVTLFLYPPSKLGLTSPVAGAMGRFAMDAQGRILISEQHAGTWGEEPIFAGRTAIPYSDFRRAVRRFGRGE